MIWGIVFITFCTVSLHIDTAHAQAHDHHGHDHSGHNHGSMQADPELVANSFPVSHCEHCPGRCFNTTLNGLCVLDGQGGHGGHDGHGGHGGHAGHADGGHFPGSSHMDGPMDGGHSHVDGHSDPHHGHHHGGPEADPHLLETSFPVRSCTDCRHPNKCTVTRSNMLCTPVTPTTSGGSRCSARPDRGRCRARMNRFYYDARTRTCRRFVFGGCGGNSNNYRRRQDCERTCRRRSNPIRRPSVSSTRKPAVCRLTANRGWCDGRRKKEPVNRFYYDARRGGCFRFKWRGCGGNRNRFTSMKGCQKKCGGHEEVGHGHDAFGHGHDAAEHAHEAIGHAHETIGHMHEAGHEAIGHAHDIGHHGQDGIVHEHGHMSHGHESIHGREGHEHESSSIGHRSGKGIFGSIRKKYGGLGRLLSGIAGRILGGSSRPGGIRSSRLGRPGYEYRPITVIVRRRPAQRSYRRRTSHH